MILFKKILCKIGIHKWKYSTQEFKYFAPSMLPGDIITMNRNVIICWRCMKKQVKTERLYYQSWVKSKYTKEVIIL